ncbi:hypothetical protein L195_g039307, partial [Trifolium pratense]
GDDETPEPKRFKTTSANCWKFFTKLGPGPNGVDLAKYNGCGKVFRAAVRIMGL